MFLSLKNGSMVLAAVCALSFTATAEAAAVKSLTQKRQAVELANTKRSDPNDERTPAGAMHKAAKSQECTQANALSRYEVALDAKSNAGGKSSGGSVKGANAVQ